MCCSPFYGLRRPRLQHGAKLLCVSDLLLLGRVTIEESRGLLHWLEEEAGFGKTGICGLSMGKRSKLRVVLCIVMDEYYVVHMPHSQQRLLH